MSPPSPPLALYLHWPFCKAKCPYCDFNSHVRHGGVDEAWFLQAYLREMDWFFQRTPSHIITSIFFGGGTPSLLSPSGVETLLGGIFKRWAVAPGCEITLEANPTSVEAPRFCGYQAAGVNRLSLGIQSLRPKALAALGRQHTVDEAVHALKLALSTFPSVSCDLIYARPHQTIEEWMDELNEALSLGTSHLSLYQLTIEPQTPYAALHAQGRLPMPDEPLSLEFYLKTQEKMEKAGFCAYEVSNYARPGHTSRHNLTYWRYGDYAGIGPGAHGRLSYDGKLWALCTEKHPETWRTQVMEKGNGLVEEEEISAHLAAWEALMMGLRLEEGVERRYLLDAEVSEDRLSPLVRDGFLRYEGKNIVATLKGRVVLNAVLGALL